jgi:hypothetical protein
MVIPSTFQGKIGCDSGAHCFEAKTSKHAAADEPKRGERINELAGCPVVHWHVVVWFDLDPGSLRYWRTTASPGAPSLPYRQLRGRVQTSDT